MNGIEIYLTIHGITTVGAIIGFFIRNEHRITKLETTLDILHREHTRIMSQHGHIRTLDKEP